MGEEERKKLTSNMGNRKFHSKWSSIFNDKHFSRQTATGNTCPIPASWEAKLLTVYNHLATYYINSAFSCLIISIISFKVHLRKIRSALGDRLTLPHLFILSSKILTVTFFLEIMVKRELFTWEMWLIDRMKLYPLHTFGEKTHKVISICKIIFKTPLLLKTKH